MNDKLLLTGASGFFGSHLQRAFADRALLTPRSAELDLNDRNATLAYFEAHRPAQVVHAAGFVGGIGLNKAHPGRMVTDNLRMGLNLLEGAAKVGSRVAIVSTICVYPADAPTPTPETAMFEGYPAEDTAFYGIAKRTLLTVAEGLAREGGLDYRYLIPTNLYGPEDYFDEAKSHVVPALIRRAVQAKRDGAEELVVWGDGTQTRDLLYVEDAAQAVKLAMGPEASRGVFNLGSGRETSIRQLAQAICDAVGFEGRLVFDATKPGGAPRRALDGGKAAATFGFRPDVHLEEGIGKTVAWYLASPLSSTP